MMATILSLISGGNGLLALLTAATGIVVAAYFKGRAAANANYEAKEAAAHERQLNDVAEANNARNRVRPTDSVSDDKYRRD
ncbi:hypothetical protein ACQKHB_23110 [Escherichia coli]|uniref:hypothetical protein n=1 Tax=Escherichia coli TaxID=562 RepID=UPI003D0940F1